jgi:hypothetical protein
VEAVAYGLPLITMRSQHSSEFVAGGAGVECEVPLYFYDVEGFGTQWPTWEVFFDLVRRAKAEGAFEPTISAMSDAMTTMMQTEPRESMRRKSVELGRGRFSVASRNERLRDVYREAVRPQ